MARPMQPDEIKRFLLEGTRTGKLAWVSQDGRPHVAPIWFLLDGEDVIFMTHVDTGKAKAMQRTGRASLLVDDQEPPYSFIKIDGPVTLTDNHPDLLDWATRIGGRYMGDDRAEEFGRRNATAGETLVRLTPERTQAFADVSD